MNGRNKQTYNEWLEKVYREKYLPAFLAFIALYPFGIEDLTGEVWKWVKDYEGLYQILRPVCGSLPANF